MNTKKTNNGQSNIIIIMIAGKKSRRAQPAMEGSPKTRLMMKPIPSQCARIPKNPLSEFGRNNSFMILFGLMVQDIEKKKEHHQ